LLLFPSEGNAVCTLLPVFFPDEGMTAMSFFTSELGLRPCEHLPAVALKELCYFPIRRRDSIRLPQGTPHPPACLLV